MPKFPQSLASGEVPSSIPYGQPSPGYWAAPSVAVGNLGEEIGVMGQRWKEVQNRLLGEQAEMESLSLAAEYDDRLAIMRTEIKRNPDPLAHETEFVRRVQELNQAMLQRSGNSITQRVLQKHMVTSFGKNVALVRSESLELFTAKKLAWLDEQEDRLSQQAAEAPTTEAHAEAVATYKSILGRFVGQMVLGEDAAQKRGRIFHEKTLEKQMDILRRTDPAKLLQLEIEGAFRDVEMGKRLRILEQVRKDDERQASRDAKHFATVRDAVQRVWAADAISRRLTDADIREAKENKNPYVSPKEALEYERLRDAPATKTADVAVATMRQRYLLGASSIARILAFRQELHDLLAQSGEPNEEGVKFADELQTDERTMLGIDAQKQSRAEQLAVQDYKAGQKTGTGIPFLDAITKAEEKIGEARVRAAVKRGADPATAVERERKRQEKKTPPLSKAETDKLTIIEEVGR